MGLDQHGVTFPLPSRFLPNVSLSEDEAAQHRASARELLGCTLEQEIDYRLTAQGVLDASQWKSFRSRDRLRVFKRRPARHQQATSPMVLAVGQIEGRVDDLLYGIHHKTTEEMRICTSFLNSRHIDAAVLHTIDTATPNDPFRRLDIKWRIAETPGGSLVSNRDVCALEYVGKRVDATGTLYGFHVVKSIDVPWFPELPDPHIVRARMMLCCIYRQRDATTLDCYMKGVFDLGGGILDVFAYETAADALFSVTKSIQCANAKKLTLELITRQQLQLQTFSRAAETALDDMGDLDTGHGKRKDCGVCHKKRPALLHRVGAKWGRCCLCQQLICAKCLVRETVFARPTNMSMRCCKLCVLASRARDVDPRAPFPVLASLINNIKA